ncbi:N-acetyltransferase family 8 member 7 [Heptranchias perlo]|uniref:N-acetyltransferase family 8 member 7 n=1 Tax=Heptranchias perlo TaxID=212740 RepID=UPI0035594811
MTDFTIRRYEAMDYQPVREIFAAGMYEHVPAACFHLLRQPWAQLLLVTVFCLLLVSSQSLILPLLALALILATAQQLVTFFWSKYIEETFNSDLLDIQETYMMKDDACFWVAECQGVVVGTVSARRSDLSHANLELKRLSVRKAYRRRGIAKALCRTVILFARENGLEEVVLGTSMLQCEAQRLYQDLGFQLQGELLFPNLLGKLINFKILMYRCEVRRGK